MKLYDFPLEKDVTFDLCKRKFPSLKDAMCQVSFCSVVLEKKTLKRLQCIFTISISSPFGEGRAPSFDQS